jgi:hypothetical protein
VRLRPLLARSSELLTGNGWAYEVKWDGFRAIVSTEDGLRVHSRRGWNMTMQLLELADLPTGLVLDGEVVALDDLGLPHFRLVCQRLLHHDESVPLVSERRSRPRSGKPSARTSSTCTSCAARRLGAAMSSVHPRRAAGYSVCVPR